MYISEKYIEEQFDIDGLDMFYDIYSKEEYEEAFENIKRSFKLRKYELLFKQLGIMFAPTMNYLLDLDIEREDLLKMITKDDTSDEILAYLTITMIKSFQDDETTMIIHGDAQVTENLNYFEFHELDDRENIEGWYKFQDIKML
jgi:hypothetical protein